MSTPWNMLVKKIFKKNRSSNKAYRLGDAMVDAKKVYKKTANSISTLVKTPFAKKGKRSTRKGRRVSRRLKKRRGGASVGFSEYKSVGGEGEKHEVLVGGNEDELSEKVVGGNDLEKVASV